MLFLKIFLVLFCIIFLLYGVILLLKFIQNYLLQKKNFQSRLQIKEQLAFDHNRKLVLFSFDDKEYLLFLGTKNEFICPSNSENVPKDNVLVTTEMSQDFSSFLKDE